MNKESDKTRTYLLGKIAADYCEEAQDKNGRVNVALVSLAKKCLDDLIEKLDEDGKSIANKLIRADEKPYDFRAHAEDIIRASSTFGGIYQDRVEKLTPTDFAEIFSDSFDYYFENEPQRERAKKFLGEFKDEYEKIARKLRKAKPILENPSDYSEDEREDAEKTAKKYSRVIALIEILQRRAIQKIREKHDKKQEKQEVLDLIGWEEKKKD